MIAAGLEHRHDWMAWAGTGVHEYMGKPTKVHARMGMGWEWDGLFSLWRRIPGHTSMKLGVGCRWVLVLGQGVR